MADLADLFPGFSSTYVATDAGRTFVRRGGSGPPLVLLHGFPQNLVIWHAIAADLAQRFTVILMDLRGYGWSSAPRSRAGEHYSKRAMGRDVIGVMDEFGYATFGLAGHDRGGRVGYRLALDHPGRLTKLALLDIIPTVEVWRSIERGSGASPHWPELARPEPEPEQEIVRRPDAYFEGLMRKWTRAKSLEPFDPRALAHYRAGWGDPSRIHAACEDYRAGATLDRADDEADEAARTTIACPVQILASTDYLKAGSEADPLDVWRRGFAPGAVGRTLESGHFLAEERPEEVLSALLDFL